jgi:hypothetical protein
VTCTIEATPSGTEKNYVSTVRISAAAAKAWIRYPLLTKSRSPSVVQWLSCLPLDPRFAGSNQAKMDFNSDKNLYHYFLLRESEAVGPMSQDFKAC